MSKKGAVFYQERLAGVIEETDEGYEFTYATEYLEAKNAKPVSLTLPLTSEKYTNKVLFAFFDGLIPEGRLLDLLSIGRLITRLPTGKFTSVQGRKACH